MRPYVASLAAVVTAVVVDCGIDDRATLNHAGDGCRQQEEFRRYLPK